MTGQPMTHEQALAYLRLMRTAVQKARSDAVEANGSDKVAEALLASIEPWLFGPKCVLPTLAKYVQRVEDGEPINGTDFLNFMVIANELEPAIALVSWFLAPASYDPQHKYPETGGLPEPDITWAGQTWSPS